MLDAGGTPALKVDAVLGAGSGVVVGGGGGGGVVRGGADVLDLQMGGAEPILAKFRGTGTDDPGALTPATVAVRPDPQGAPT